MSLLFDNGVWQHVKDGNPRAFALYKRHYSYREYADGRRDDPSNPNRRLFLGPGEKMVLLTTDGDALFAWRKFKDDSGQQGVNCAVFRNESPHKASELIRLAEIEAAIRWPMERTYTYVNAGRVSSEIPGYCFRRAGWRHVGDTKGGLLIFAKSLPARVPSMEFAIP